MSTIGRASGPGCCIHAFILLCLVSPGLAHCHAAESDQRFRGRDAPGVSANWREVPLSARLAILRLLEEQTKGNYERIITWKGAYRVQAQQHLSKEAVKMNVAPMVRSNPRGEQRRPASPLVQSFNYVQLFAIDISTGSVYRARDTVNLKWLDDSREWKIPSAVPIEERSIVTSEEYIHFPPKTVWPEFEAVAGFPRAQYKHAAFRDAPEKAANKHFGDLMDPRCFFGLDSGAKFWEGLNLVIQGLQEGRAGVLSVYEAVDSRRPCYRIVRELQGPGGASKRYLTSVWDSEQGFNAVSLTASRDASGKELVTRRNWSWVRSGGVYVPAGVDEALYDARSGRLTYHREVKLEQSAVNEPLDPAQFTYKALGLRDDDLVMDRIENVCYVMHDGNLVKVADFGDKYKPGIGKGSWLPIVLCSVTIAFLAAIVLFSWRRRARHRSV
jgi:hypothetical protein